MWLLPKGWKYPIKLFVVDPGKKECSECREVREIFKYITQGETKLRLCAECKGKWKIDKATGKVMQSGN